jgi:predicted ABC-type ATPase
MNKRPRLIVIAGPNGSGKSTLTAHLMKNGMDFGVYINPDDIAKTLTGNDYENVRKAQRIAEAKRFELLEAGISHSFESVMSHPSKVKYIVTAKNKGFYTILVFVGINDPQINIARVSARVAEGGHGVPQEKIVARYKRTMEMLFDASMEADEALVFDNTDPQKGLRLAAKVEGKKLIKYDPQFPWVRKYLVSKIEGGNP